jgi:Uma2 family endonuclease
MNVALRRRMSLDECLVWEDRQERKWEFDGFQPVAIVGVTDAHAAIQANLLAALVQHLRGKPCRPRGSALRIEVAGSIRYPDAFVYCTPIAGDTRVVTEPVVVFEILSPSTEHVDLVVKNAEYRATPSIQRYVVLQQMAPGATVYSRKADDWVTEIVFGEDALRMPEIGIEIPLAELYLDVAFPVREEESPKQAS